MLQNIRLLKDVTLLLQIHLTPTLCIVQLRGGAELKQSAPDTMVMSMVQKLT